LEGVAVAAHWQSDIHTLGGRIPGSQIMILGVVTDANGRFYLPGWGPRIYIQGSVDEKIRTWCCSSPATGMCG